MYCIQVDCTCIALLLLLLFSICKTPHNKNNVSSLRALIVIVVIACLSDMMIYIFDGRAEVGNEWILNIASFIHYTFAGLSSMVGSYYIIQSNEMQLSRSEKIVGIMPEVLLCVLSFLSMFYNLIFFVEDHVYQRGNLYSVHILITIIYLIIGIYASIKNYKNKISLEEKHMEILRLGIIVMPIAGAVLQSLYYGILLIWPLTTFAILAFYLFSIHHELNFDGLTEVYRKNVYEENASRIIFTKPKSVLITIDIDRFKMINDSYGHKQGDMFLRLTARLLKTHFSESSLVGRIGGDEFSVVIYNYESLEVIQKMCDEFLLAASQLMKEVAKIEYSCSAGISENKRGDSYDDAYQNSDRALYFAKKSGRNCYKIYNPEMLLHEENEFVLIVEDDELNRIILSSYMEGRCDVLEAKDGETALEYIRKYQSRIGFILLDLMMKPMDGYQVLGTIKEEQLFDPARIVIQSSKDIGKEECDSLGVYGAIKKPYDPNIILDLIQKFIV